MTHAAVRLCRLDTAAVVVPYAAGCVALLPPLPEYLLLTAPCIQTAHSTAPAHSTASAHRRHTVSAPAHRRHTVQRGQPASPVSSDRVSLVSMTHAADQDCADWITAAVVVPYAVRPVSALLPTAPGSDLLLNLLVAAHVRGRIWTPRCDLRSACRSGQVGSARSAGVAVG